MKKIFLLWKKILIVITLIILIFAIIIILFTKLWLPFGETLSRKNEEIYINRANNYRNGKFYNENKLPIIDNEYYEHSFISSKTKIPINEIPTEKPDLSNNNINKFNLTWLGHSSLLLQLQQMNILIDPFFSDRPSPLSNIGPKRFIKVPINKNDLPNINIVIITHDHYDHLDYQTIKDIDDKVEKYVVPLGVENHLKKWNINENKIIYMAWWEEINLNGLLIGCTPARHNSGRTLFNQNSTLWASWVLINNNYKVYISGDSGYDIHFKKIYDKYQAFDLALLDSGQYDTRWKTIHMTPEEAVNAGRDLKAKVIMPIHWGSIKLARHPWDDPVERFIASAEKEKINYTTPKIGKTVEYNNNMSKDKWWKNIK